METNRRMASKQPITIITTNFLCADVLLKNLEIIRNTIIPDKFVIIENSPNPQFVNWGENVQVIKGIKKEQLNETQNSEGERVNKNSFHHGWALNKGIEYIDPCSKYVLFVDSDFFILQDIGNIIKYMENNNLSFFGAPYPNKHPNSKNKGEMFFPTAFCMFVNLEKVDVKTFDFLPPLTQETYQEWLKLKTDKEYSKEQNETHFHSKKTALLDTGHNVYHKYANDEKHKTEIAEIVLEKSPATGMLPVAYIQSQQLNKFYKKIMYNNVFDLYQWQNKLFGLHVHLKLHLCNVQSRQKKQKITCESIEGLYEFRDTVI